LLLRDSKFTKNSEVRERKRNYCQKKKAKKQERKRQEDEANGGSSGEHPKGNKTILQRKYWESEGSGHYGLGTFCQVMRVNWRIFGLTNLRNRALSCCFDTTAQKGQPQLWKRLSQLWKRLGPS